MSGTGSLITIIMSGLKRWQRVPIRIKKNRTPIESSGLSSGYGVKASRFLKARLKQAGVGYKELVERLNRHGPHCP